MDDSEKVTLSDPRIPRTREFVHSLLSDSSTHYHALGRERPGAARLLGLVAIIFVGTFG